MILRHPGKQHINEKKSSKRLSQLGKPHLVSAHLVCNSTCTALMTLTTCYAVFCLKSLALQKITGMLYKHWALSSAFSQALSGRFAEYHWHVVYCQTNTGHSYLPSHMHPVDVSISM